MSSWTPRTCAARKCSAGTPSIRCSRSTPPGRAGQQKAARLASPTESRTARPGKKPPGLRRAKRPAAAVLPAADVPPATHPRHCSPAPAPGCPPLQQKQRRFVHLAFPGWTAAIAPAVATRSTRIRALKFGLSGLVDRSIPDRWSKASQLDRFPGLASRSAPGLSRGLLPCTSHNAALCKRALLQG